MRDAAGTLRIVGGAGVDEGVEAKDGGFGALADDEGQSIWQDSDGRTFFEACKVLCLRSADKSDHTESDRCNSNLRSCQNSPPETFLLRTPLYRSAEPVSSGSGRIFGSLFDAFGTRFASSRSLLPP